MSGGYRCSFLALDGGIVNESTLCKEEEGEEEEDGGGLTGRKLIVFNQLAFSFLIV